MKSNQKKDSPNGGTDSMEEVSNGKRSTAWLLLQSDSVVFLQSRNLRKMCTMELVPRAPHWAMMDDMDGVATIETKAIVPNNRQRFGLNRTEPQNRG